MGTIGHDPPEGDPIERASIEPLRQVADWFAAMDPFIEELDRDLDEAKRFKLALRRVLIDRLKSEMGTKGLVSGGLVFHVSADGHGIEIREVGEPPGEPE